MNWSASPLRKVRAWFRKETLDREMSEELRAHLERETAANVADGMTPEDARHSALRSFGHLEGIKERCRDQRGWRWLEQSLQDLRYALRQPRRAPGFTLVAVLSLALGIGANTAFFSVFNEIALKPLPVEKPNELALFTWTGDIGRYHIAGSFHDIDGDAKNGAIGANFTYLSYQRFRASNETLRSLFAFATVGGHTAVVDGQAEIVGDADYVSGEYFEGLGVGARVGRTLTGLDDRLGAPLVAMISHAYWQQRFGGDASVVGKTVSINATPVTIVGVTPQGFRGVKAFGRAPTFFLPLAFLDSLEPGTAEIATKPGHRWFFGIMGRLKSGMSMEQARANFEPVFEQSVRDGSLASGASKDEAQEAGAHFPQLILERGNNGSDGVLRSSASKLTILLGLMGLVLLIACANVANLLLARGAARRREIAVRLALGASRSRLVRQLLTENLLLAAAGGLLGVVVAGVSADTLAAMLKLGDVDHITLDWRVFGFAAAASLLTGLLCGLAPARRAARIDLNAEFQGGPRSVGSGTRPMLHLRRWLMVTQVALSFVVLAGAGLFVLTVRNLRATDVGFARDHLLLFHLDAAAAGYKPEQLAALFERVADRIRALPGVPVATFSSVPVVSGANEWNGVRILGGTAPISKHPPAAAINEVDSDFFRTFGLRPIIGRILEPRDSAQTPKVAVINEAMAAKFFPGEIPLGRHFTTGQGDLEVVGVVRNIKYGDVREPAPPSVYSPFAQKPAGRANFAVRTMMEPEVAAEAIRRAIRAIEPNLPMANVRTQDEQIEMLLGEERMFARLSSLFGGLAVALVCVGLYGLMSYAVVCRTNEIGVRMALGARPGQVLKMMLRESLALIGIGIVVGMAGAGAATRIVAGILYGLSPTDPLTYGGAGLVLVAVAILACWLPARRAARVDPLVALRHD